jgi:hypothetical protein
MKSPILPDLQPLCIEQFDAPEDSINRGVDLERLENSGEYSEPLVAVAIVLFLFGTRLFAPPSDGLVQKVGSG